MELVPRIPSERVVRAVLGGSIAAVCGVTLGSGVEFLGVAGGALGALVSWLLVRPILETDRASRAEGALDRFECLTVVAGRSVFVAGLLALLTHGWVLRTIGAGAIVSAFALLALTLVRDRARLRFLERVYAKEHPSFRIEPDADVRGWELLPPVVSGVITDAVVAHVGAEAATYRTSDGPRPLARVASSLARMAARLDRRSRSAGMLVAGLACSASIVAVVPGTTAAHTSPLVAPACRDAIPYFEDRLESLPGVGRATLLTHAQDPSIAEGHGVLLVAPHPTDATKVSVLALAQTFPCREPLALTVEEPTYRRFDVRAVLALEPGADEDAVVRDADREVRALFEPSSAAVESEPVRFGLEEKTFGYRVRYALRHVVGVKSVSLSLDGSDHDVRLAPRDFPTLGSLSVTVGH